MSISIRPAQGIADLPARRLLATTIGLMFCAAGTPVLAEETNTAAAKKSDDESETLLNKVLVKDKSDPYKSDTAASPKYTAPLVDTPKSVTVIPKEVIQQTGSTTLVEALRTTPGITMGAGEGGNPVGDRPFNTFDCDRSAVIG